MTEGVIYCCYAAYPFAQPFVVAAAAAQHHVALLCSLQCHCIYPSLQGAPLLPPNLRIFFVFSSSETSFLVLILHHQSTI